jgi:hypothetical protein
MTDGSTAPTRLRSVLTALLVVTGVVVVIIVLLARGRSSSDEHAIRAWFQTPAGGSMPKDLVASIHVGACDFTDAVMQSRQVLKCHITTDAPTPALGTCFVIANGHVLRGGWQLATLDACNALRFDTHTGQLQDTVARAHYPVKAS